MSNDGMSGMNGLDTSGGPSSRSINSGRPSNGIDRVGRPAARDERARKGHARTIGLLLVFAAAIVIVSAAALAPATEKAAKPDSPAKTISKPEPPPFVLSGLTMDASGTMLFGVNVTITNLRSGDVNWTDSIDYMGSGYAYYEFNLNKMASPIADGDIIQVVGTYPGLTGQNQSAVQFSLQYMIMDITLNPVVIPEFPIVLAPVAGLLVLVVAVSLGRRFEDP